MPNVIVRSIVISFLVLAPAFAATKDPALEALMNAGHWKRLRAQVAPRVQANPNDAEAAYLMSNVKQAFGDLNGSLELAEKSVALDGNHADYHAHLAEVCISIGQNAGLFKGIGMARRFRKEADAAIALDPKNLDAREGLLEFYFEAPGIAGGDKPKGHAMAEEIMRIDPVRGWFARARVAQQDKDAAKQEAAYLEAVKANPKSYEAQVALANFYVSDAMKKYDAAEKPAREALKLDPARGGAYVALAQLYAKQGRAADLEALLAQAEKNAPDDLSAHYQAGKMLFVAGKDLPRAEGYFRKYLTQEPEGFQPNWAAAHWRLGLVLEKENRKPEAINELQAAVQLDPQLEEARKDLKRLK